jgi:hypothetical protein
MLTDPAPFGALGVGFGVGFGVGLGDGVLGRSVGELDDEGDFVAVDAGPGVVADPDVDEDPPAGVSLHPASALNSRSTPTTLTIRR